MDCKAPPLEELVSERLDSRTGKKDVALVISTFNNPSCLKRHLEILEKQTFRDFDLLIVYGSDDDFVERKGTLHIRERGRNGCEGAFYIGQASALDEGYSTCIFADDDCFPVSENLIEELVKSAARGNRVTFPFRKSAGLDIRSNLVFHYGCFRSDFLQRIGLTYYPFYFGGGDLELLERIKKAGAKPFRPDVRMTHPPVTPPFLDHPQKRYYYVRGGFQAAVISGNFWKGFLDTNAVLVGGLTMLLFGKKERARVLLRGLLDGIRMRFYKTDIRAEDDRKLAEAEGWQVIRPERKLTLDKVRHYRGAEGIKMLAFWVLQTLSLFLEFRKYFGKRIVFDGVVKPGQLPIMLMAKGLCLRHEGKTYEIFDGRGLFGRLLGPVLLALLLPAIILASGLAIVAGALLGRGISTWGYGTRGYKKDNSE